MQESVLRDLLAESKDGEWGKGEPADDLVEMLVIRGTDFESVRVGDLSSVPRRFIPKRIADRKALRPYDLLIETAGGSKDRPTGRTLFIKPEVIRKSGLPVTCASFARFLRIDFARADAEYVFWLLQAMYESRQLLKYHTQHTGVARYQFTTFADNEPLLLPDMATQRRIASILSAYDDLIENNTRRIAILEEMARRIYEEWFVRFRFPGHEQVKMVESELGLIPEGWGLRAFDEVASFVNGYAFKPDDWGTSGLPIIKIKELKSGIQSDTPRYSSSLQEKYHVRNGALLFSWSADLDVYIWAGGEGWLNQHLFIVKALSEGIPASWLFHALKASMPNFRSRSNGATMKHIKRSALSEVKVLLSPESLMNEFSVTVQPMHDLVISLTQKNRNLRATRDLLLPKLISGELDVSTLPEPEEAIAA